MKKIEKYGVALLCLIVIVLFAACKKQPKAGNQVVQTAQADNEVLPEVRYEYGIAVDSFEIVEGTIQNGETLGGIFNRLGANAQQIKEISTLKSDVFDARYIRVGKEYKAYYESSEDTLSSKHLCYFVYCKDAVNSVVLDLRDSIRVELHQKEVNTVLQTMDVTIESSLWNALVAAEKNTQVAIELSEIYQWTVDFFGLQKGDRFKACYEERFVEDTISLGISRILACSYIANRDTVEAYFFDSLDTHGYFDATGKNLQKAFLKAPLNYKRISSTFTYNRVHPIYKTVRPHTGVDYAAPMGTPVVALGDGVVTDKYFDKKGGGNTVKIRHNGTYTTGYLHLSKYGKIAVGQRVKQGEVIGYVGSTGASTGPHLDFRVWKNGTPIDPLKMESPSADPVPAAYKTEFDSIVQIWQPMIK